MRSQPINPVQPFPVIPVANPRGEIERRGARRKFWVTLGDDRTEWLLKFPRPDTGEHWAEKVAGEVGRLFGINTARVELARAGGELATVCQSFLTDEESSVYDASHSALWLHGSRLLRLADPHYNVRQIRPNRSHNLKAIVAAVRAVVGVGDAKLTSSAGKVWKDLASYALLDGLIGNTDRHHDNWMVVYGVDAGNLWMRAAPSFDHASSLGRELTDERRGRVIDSKGVLNYLRRARGGVFINGERRRAPSPLYLAQLLCRWQPGLAEDWAKRLEAVEDADIQSIIERIPSEFMSDLAGEFAYRVVVTSKAELYRSIR